jgi:hypothetical protein
LYSTSLEKTEQGLQKIYKECVESGSSCPLHEATVEAIKQRIRRLQISLDKRPIIVHKSNNLGIVNGRQVHRALFMALVRPYRLMRPLFGALHDLENGDGLAFFESFSTSQITPTCDCESETQDPTGGQESANAVRCADGVPVPTRLEDFYEHFKQLANISIFGDIWTEIRLNCL